MIKTTTVLVAGASPKECEIVATRIVSHYRNIGIDADKVDMSHPKGLGSYKAKWGKCEIIVLYNDAQIHASACSEHRPRKRDWGGIKVDMSFLVYTTAVNYIDRNYDEPHAKRIINELISRYIDLPRGIYGATYHRELNTNRGKHGLLLACGKAINYINQLIDGGMW